MGAKRFKHMANSGDLIACMAAMKKYNELTGNNIIVCQQLNVKANYPSGATHPVMDEKGIMVCMSAKMLGMIEPLLLSQEYIEDVEVYVGQKVDFDIDEIRQKTFVNLPYMAIQQWIMMAYPDLGTDLSNPWIDVPPIEGFENKIIVNFTDRYRNYVINYFFLKEYQEHLIFAGAKTEHENFCKEWNLEMPYLEADNFYDLARIVKSCKFLLANQSMMWNLAEAMKSPRILEMCSSAPNCQPFIGKDSYGFFHQVSVEYYVKYMFNK